MVACSVAIRPAAWSSNHVGAAAGDLGDALLGGGEFAVQALDLTRHDGRKLFERIAGFSKLILPVGELLVQRI